MVTHTNLLVLVLVFLLCPLLAQVQACVRGEGEEGCVGGRPPTPNGCCPAGGGEECGEEEVGVQCDEALGFRCLDNEGSVTTRTGRCTGRYNLHVTETGTNSVSLEWNGFLPAGYYFEYVLLFRNHSYAEDTASWTLWDIGRQAQYTVRKLSAGTLYFMRLALWVDARATVLGNLSEVIWVRTDSATHCSHNGETFQVGQVVDNCEDRCTCTATGRMQCTPSCPRASLPEVPEGCTLVFEEECSCNATVTCPPGDRVDCEYNGHTYADGSTWIDTINCTMCTCEAGYVICRLTCPEPEVPEGCVNPRQTAGESGCCPVIVCDNSESVEGPEGCQHNGTAHPVGATFTVDCALCVCSPGGRVNCSSAACPELELPMPGILCPNPHVRREGCCDTVFCIDENPDPQALLSRLMALSFGPDSLTISFDVDHVTSSEGVTQDRYEVMMSDGQGAAASWTSSTYMPTMVDADDNVSSPSDLLHADSAIRVDDRVYITLDGLRPNTTYYVRVVPVVKRDMGVTEPASNTSLTGFFVARTMEEDRTCLVGDVMYQNGDVVSDDCQNVCKCVGGDVNCHRRACPEEQLVMAPSVTCPRPQLVRSDQSCCKTWRCFPEDDDDCIFKDTILKHGEAVYEGACGSRCSCTRGELTCTPVCSPVPPAPRSDCVLTNVTHTCCPVWMCQQETKPPVGMLFTSHIGFHGDCTKRDTFRTSLRRAFEDGIKGHLPCADRESPFFVACWVTDVVVICPRVAVYRTRRQTRQIELVAVIAANITDSNTEGQIHSSFNETENAITALLAAGNFKLPVEDGMILASSGTFHRFRVNFVCPDEFVYQQDMCVPKFVYPPPSLQPNVTMTATSLSPYSVTLTWTTLSPTWLSYVTALVMQYRVTSSSEWWTVTLDPVTSNHTLRNLSASQHYTARLVAVMTSASSDTVSLSTVQFATAHREVLTAALTFDPLQVSLGVTSVTLSWPALPSDVTAAISSMKVTYRQSTDVDEGKLLDLDPHTSQVTLSGLEPGRVYVMKFVVRLVNGTTVTMAPLHFVTKDAESSKMPVIPLLATCTVLVLLSVLVPVIFFVWRRMRRKSGPETAFENKTYGVNISSLCATRAKNESARPQDPDHGSAAVSSTGDSDCPLQA